ncbi:MAG: hypothetical protein ACK4IX_18565 [Candidatus Sericytochromatia bacterium]
MKKILLLSLFLFSFSSCNSTVNNNPPTSSPSNSSSTPPVSPSNSPSSSTPVGDLSKFATKQEFIDFANCIIAKPDIAQNIKNAFKAFIGTASNFSDEQWSGGSGRIFDGYKKEYSSSGCVK